MERESGPAKATSPMQCSHNAISSVQTPAAYFGCPGGDEKVRPAMASHVPALQTDTDPTSAEWVLSKV